MTAPVAPTTPLAAIVLAAGEGTRMKSRRPKVLHGVAGRSLVGHVLATLAAEQVARVVVVIGPGMDAVAAAVAPHPCVVQAERRGTGHAVLQAAPALEDFAGDVLIVYGDTPFVTPATYARMRIARAGNTQPALVVLGFEAADPAGYGRLIVNGNSLERIVEARDATPAERNLRLCNSGIMLVDAAVLWRLLPRVQANNAKGEYYLTDLVALARSEGLGCAVVMGEEQELLGINSRAELAAAESLVQARLRSAALDAGVTFADPASVFLAADTRLGQDVEIGPFCVFGPGVTVEDGVAIKGFCHIEGAHIASGAVVGPFARLRPGARIAAEAHVGNFVEIKNAVLERGAKVNHLTYIGDARVGAGANVGAGTITANYDGFNKSHTDIGAGASIGSNAVLVAPVKIGEGAMVAAGAVVRKDVPADALAVNEGGQQLREGFAARYRAKKKAEKAARSAKAASEKADR
jgi:bifunctional UDP-N-acetylglucosamine pyrophosphorylase/glucosamine-1-phosphate N-acetyltransferase